MKRGMIGPRGCGRIILSLSSSLLKMMVVNSGCAASSLSRMAGYELMWRFIVVVFDIGGICGRRVGV